MARLDLTRNILKGNTNAAPLEVAGNGQAVLLADGAQFDLTGGEIVVVRNPSGGALSVTLVAVADAQGRTTNLVESIAAAATVYLGPLQPSPAAWRQSTGKCHLDVSADGLTVTLLTSS